MKFQLFKNDLYKDIPADDLKSQQRYKLYRTISVTAIFILISIFIQCHFLDISKEIYLFLAVTLLGTAVALVLNYVLLQKHRNVDIAYLITVFFLFFIVHVTTYFAGGIRNPGMMYLGTIILSVFMLLGNRTGWFFFAIAIVNLIFFYQLSQTTHISNILQGTDATAVDQDFVLTGILAILFLTAQIAYLESGKNVVVKTITQQRDELRQANSELKKLSLVASKADNAISITDAEGVIEWVNDGYCRLSGHKFDDLIGKSIGSLLTGVQTDHSELNNMMAELVKQQTYSGEMLKYHADGSTFWVQTTMTPIFDDDGEISQFILIESDITAKKDAQVKMEAYLRDLEKSHAELDQFAYVVSHDLKAPLRAIGQLTGMIEFEVGDTLPEDAQTNFTTIKGRVVRMEGLINGLLEYSRAHQSQSQEELVDIENLIKETIEFLGYRDECQCEIGEMPELMAEKIQMEQVFSNLIGNAVKYNDKDIKLLDIKAEKKDGEWLFSVKDNGPGIDQKYHEKVFQIFQTLQPRDQIESTGVGLSIVKKIISERGGKVWIESKEGMGSTFFFTWPEQARNINSHPFVNSVQAA